MPNSDANRRHYFRFLPDWLKAAVPLVGLLLLAYFPTITHVYDYHDSLHFYDYTRHSDCLANPLLPLHAFFGRPMYSILYCYSVAKVMGGISNAGWIRLEGLLFAIAAASLLRVYLRRCGVAARPALFAAAGAFMFPGLQQFIYASHGVPLMICFLLPIGAAFGFERFMASLDQRRQIGTLWWLGLTVAMLTLSSLTYQSVTEVFLALVFVRVLTLVHAEGVKSSAAFLLWGFAIYVLHGLAYLAFHYMVDLPFVAGKLNPTLRQVFNGSRTISFSLDQAGRSAVFWGRTVRALTLWFYGSVDRVAALIAVSGGVLYVAMTIQTFRDARTDFSSILKKVVSPLLLVVFFVALTNATTFLIQDPEGLLYLFRTMMAYQWILLFFGAWMLSRIHWGAPSSVLTAVCWISCAAVAGFVHAHLYYNFVQPNADEFARATSALAAALKDKPTGKLCVIPPVAQVIGIRPEFNVIDEFGHTTMMYSNDIVPTMRAAAHRLSIPQDSLPEVVALGADTASADAGCESVIDMRLKDAGPSAFPPQSAGSTIGIFRPPRNFGLSLAFNVEPHIGVTLGQPGDVPIAGDWDGDGFFEVGVYRPEQSVFRLLRRNSLYALATDIQFGRKGDVPIVGDWDGNHTVTIGVYRPEDSTFRLRNSNSPGEPDIIVPFGKTGDIPIAGDWNGKGPWTIGVFRPNETLFLLRYSNTAGPPEADIPFGVSGDLPIVGDWDGNGTMTLGVYAPNSIFSLRNSNTKGEADITQVFGASGDRPVAGKWNRRDTDAEVRTVADGKAGGQ